MRYLYATILLLSMTASAQAARAQVSGEDILRAAAHAMGRFDARGSLVSRGTVQAEGRTGNWTQTLSLTDGRFVERSSYSLFAIADGFDGTRRWHQDRSGAHHFLNAPFTRADSRTEAWLRRRGYLDPRGARVLATNSEVVDGHPATIVVIRPPGGNSLRLAFDNATHLLVRSERQRPISTTVESYSDYRTVGRARIPFSSEIQESGDTTVIHLSSAELTAGMSDSKFRAPAFPNDTFVNGVSTVPAFVAGYFIVPATVNGQKFLFLVDTGGHDILTPHATARLGLTPEGHGTSGGSGAGRVSQSDTRISELRIGDAKISNLHFYVIDLGFNVESKTPFGGILGLELFERLMLTIDEEHKLLTVAPRSSAVSCKGNSIPLFFDEDEPVAHGTIDSVPGALGIDTGNASSLVIFWKWAQAHGLTAKYRAGQTSSSSGMGGETKEWETPDHTVTIGPAKLSGIMERYNEDKAGAFSSITDAGNIGRDLLEHYAVTFDYARSRMCLEPSVSKKP
jgi:hypothetical protein